MNDVLLVSYTCFPVQKKSMSNFSHPELRSVFFRVSLNDAYLKPGNVVVSLSYTSSNEMVVCGGAVRLQESGNEPAYACFSASGYASMDVTIPYAYKTLSNVMCTVWVTMSKDADLIKYLNQQFPSNSLGRTSPRAPVAALWEKRPFADVTLQVEGQDLPAHKAVLTACSSVFEAMFSHDFRESKENVVVISDISLKAMTAALRYLYTAQLDAPDAKLDVELVEVSERYSLSELKKLAEDGLAFLVASTKEAELAATLLRTSRLYKLKNLQAACEKVLIMKRGQRDVDLLLLAKECGADVLRRVMQVRLATLPGKLLPGEGFTQDFAVAQPALVAEITKMRVNVNTLGGCP